MLESTKSFSPFFLKDDHNLIINLFIYSHLVVEPQLIVLFSRDCVHLLIHQVRQLLLVLVTVPVDHQDELVERVELHYRQTTQHLLLKQSIRPTISYFLEVSLLFDFLLGLLLLHDETPLLLGLLFLLSYTQQVQDLD